MRMSTFDGLAVLKDGIGDRCLLRKYSPFAGIVRTIRVSKTMSINHLALDLTTQLITQLQNLTYLWFRLRLQ